MTQEDVTIPGGGRGVTPKPTIGFFVRNIGTLIKMKRADRTLAEKQVAAVKRLDSPLVPGFEGTGGPMEEGMIYLHFNSLDGEGLPDSAFRVFWVNAPSLRFSFFDSFLVSEGLASGQWDRSYPRGILLNRSRNRFHQEVALEGFSMECDGTWDQGYRYRFEDRIHRIAGDVAITPRPGGVLTYFNGRTAVTPTMVQRFYDMFALDVVGKLELQGKTLDLKKGHAIIEHGLGIFSNYSIYDWRWLNLSLSNGGVVHLFYYSLDYEKEGIYAAGEGAALVGGEWHHFLAGDFAIEETGYGVEEGVPTKIPVRWRVTAGRDESGRALLDLEMEKAASISWVGTMGKENEFISDYVMKAGGTWKGEAVTAKGTMENQMHRIIE